MWRCHLQQTTPAARWEGDLLQGPPKLGGLCGQGFAARPLLTGGALTVLGAVLGTAGCATAPRISPQLR